MQRNSLFVKFETFMNEMKIMLSTQLPAHKVEVESRKSVVLDFSRFLLILEPKEITQMP